jgi:hypothetical protein
MCLDFKSLQNRELDPFGGKRFASRTRCKTSRIPGIVIRREPWEKRTNHGDTRKSEINGIQSGGIGARFLGYRCAATFQCDLDRESDRNNEGAQQPPTCRDRDCEERAISSRSGSSQRLASAAAVHFRRNHSASRLGLRRLVERNGRPNEASPRIPLSPDRRLAPQNRRLQ